MPRFVYSQLNPDRGEIRLISLPPGRFEDSLNLEIFHAPLSEDITLEYEAVSYVWGPVEDPGTVVVNQRSGPPALWRHRGGRLWPRAAHTFSKRWPSSGEKSSRFGPGECSPATLSITKNLAALLRSLRRVYTWRILWVDAICIDQENHVERSAEVSRMGTIYGKARQVIVWLGPESENSRLAMRTLQWIGQNAKFVQKHSMLWRSKRLRRLEQKPEALAAKELAYIAIRDLLCRPWFTRLWIHQEIKLGRCARAVVGASELSWKDFGAAIYWFLPVMEKHKSLSHLFDMDYLYKHIIFTLRSHEEDTPLLALIHGTRNASCSDPRDRVYGILSMLTTHTNLGIIPDYTKTKEEVFEDLARRHIWYSQTLQVLLLCDLQRRSFSSTLPTWVPDLSVPKLSNGDPLANASGQSKYEASFVDDIHGLQVTGVRVGMIEEVGNAFPCDHDVGLSEFLAICRSWEPPNIMDDYVGGGKALDAFMKTLVCGQMREDSPAHPSTAPGVGPHRLGFPATLEECRKAFFSLLQEEQVTDQNRNFYYLSQGLRGRRFCTLSRGYFGAFPLAAREGDLICVVLGSLLPLVLRRTGDDKFQLVGECYVPGIMDGEALLGSLPSTWEMGPLTQSGHRQYLNGTLATLEDPRLGPLSSGWQTFYPDGEVEADGDVDFKYLFKNQRTGETSYFDPRLTKGCLIEKGVAMKDFLII